jgi:hypothetical protein
VIHKAAEYYLNLCDVEGKALIIFISFLLLGCLGSLGKEAVQVSHSNFYLLFFSYAFKTPNSLRLEIGLLTFFPVNDMHSSHDCGVEKGNLDSCSIRKYFHTSFQSAI